MQISSEQIQNIAPDEKSMVAAGKLLSPRLWQAGVSEEAIWGTCGRGRNYQVCVDFADLGYRCNCPSRKFPCKHVLALLMLFSSTPDLFSLEPPPEWVGQWLEKRKLKREKKLQQDSEPAKRVDPVAQAKRIETREANVSAGIEQLIHWLDDIVRSGIATLETKPFTFWDRQARRLVDAQAKGLANRVRNLAEIPGSTSDWAKRMMDELGRIRLLIEAYQRSNQLSSELRADVRQLVGWTISQADLENHNDKVHDEWFLWGQRLEEEERFRTQRSWAIGIESNREALILQFAPGRQGFPETIIPGTLIKAEMLFYPGASPQRAKISKREETSEERNDFPLQQSISEFLESYSDQIARNPWLPQCGCLLSNVTLTQYRNQWWIRDKSGAALPCTLRSPLEILSQTGGHPFQVHAEWNGHILSPLSYIYQGSFETC